MMRAALELADVLRRHGPTYREVHADSLSHEQHRVMAAIEQCRTAALGGHVEQCDACVNVDRNFPRSVEVKIPTLCSR
jgi:predicted aldo/keto reductase-like oxidoreductase